jgi:hypothetical protein
MKKITSLILAALLAVQAYAADANPFALTQTTDADDITTIVTAGRAQVDIALNADGSLTFAVYPAITRLTKTGKPIGKAFELDTSNQFQVVMPPAMLQEFFVQIKAAYAAKLAAEAQAVIDAKAAADKAIADKAAADAAAKAAAAADAAAAAAATPPVTP